VDVVNVATHCYIEKVIELALVSGGLLVVLVATGFSTLGPVSRYRLELFARRQRLTVTADNGNQIIRYLATVRRWRVAGLTAGAAVVALGPVRGDALPNLNYVALFSGWFLGALVAEVRVAHLAHGPVRVASLQRRAPRAYLGRLAWALVPAAAGVIVALAILTAQADASGWAEPGWTAWFWAAAALAVAVAVRAIQRAVLRRPQPVAAPDVLAGDDAIRSRSLHVLAGGGAALVLYCGLMQLGGLNPVGLQAAEQIESIRQVSTLLVAGLGVYVATAVWPPYGWRRQPTDASVATG